MNVDREPKLESYDRWQQDVVRLLHESYAEVLGSVALNDIEWSAWKPFFDNGLAPRRAIDRAFEQDY